MRNLPFACPSTNPLAEDHEENSKEANQEHDSRKQHSQHQEPIRKDPSKDLVPDTKGQKRLGGDENGDKFRGIVVVAIDHVSDKHGEPDEICKLEDTEAGEEAKPMESVVGCTGEDCHTHGGTNDCGEEDP